MKINDKLSHYSLLIKEDKLLPNLPETKLFNQSNFYEFLNKYHQTYLRTSQTDNTSILITSHENHLYEIESGSKKMIIDGKQNAFEFLTNTFIKEEKVIIQQGVPRARIDENHFDIRVFVVKTNSGWRIAEKLGRIIPGGYSVTDELREIFPVQDILKKIFPDNVFSQNACSRIDELAIQTATLLETTYPKYQLIITDFIIDLTGKPWINQTRYKLGKGKWDLHHILRGEKELFPYLPETYPFHHKILDEHLEKYNKTLIKPCLSQWGLGIALISGLPDQTLEVHSERRKIPFQEKNEMLEFINKEFLAKKEYLIQELIPLARINDSPFDVRVMVQRKSVSSDWEITGKVTRTAVPGFIVTNVAKELTPLDEAIENSMIPLKNPESLHWEIDRISKLVAKQLEKVFPSSLMWGLDIGIDQDGKPWFIEANLVPDISLFRYLEDKTMLKTIKEFIREGKKHQ